MWNRKSKSKYTRNQPRRNDDDVDCNNNKTQNKVKNEVIVNNNYKKIEAVEECNDENKSI